MFLASMNARTQPYSTRQAAERELATHIRKSVQMNNVFPDFKAKIVRLSSQEKYGEIIHEWNHFVMMQLNCNSIYMAEVVEMRLDQPFK